jgi:hydrogenase maturation protein HypF
MFEWKDQWVNIDFKWDYLVNKLIEGKIISVMGLSGSHFVMDALNSNRILEFRNLRRQQSDKPFAVMMKNIAEIEKYCHLTEQDKKLLHSVRKPIVILPVKDQPMWENISPGLESIGVMLPYTGFHHILFSKGAPSVLIMTSGNQPGIPMPIVPEDVLKSSESISDLVLVHNRKIIQRNDDSVIRSHGKYQLIIRRSRGYTPQPFFVEQLVNQPQFIAFGSEENNTLAFHKAGWVLPSQHLGHVTNLESQTFRTSTQNHIANLFKFAPELVLTDLHPDFLTTKSAEEFAEINGMPIYRIQHHVAHAASLALDHNIGRDEQLLTWVCDGFGYGPDGNAWGGELILIGDGAWERISSLSPIDYEGGDQNARYPARMLLNYLKAIDAPLDFLSNNAGSLFSHGIKEFNYLSNKKTRSNLTTSSLGRLLDCFAVLLGVTEKRSYRGEPAIKLEGLASRGTSSIDVNPKIGKHNNMDVVDNRKIMSEALDLMNSVTKENLAYWIHQTIGKTLGTIAGKQAEHKGITNIGFSGGVAYNKLITESLMLELDNFGINLLIHNKIPPGDGGISTGQIYYQGVLQNE